MSKYKKPMTPEEIAQVEDSDIDFSDIPELDANFWDNAVVIQPDTTQPVTLRVKQSVLEYFKADGKGYQTRINAVLESYVETQQNKQH